MTVKRSVLVWAHATALAIASTGIAHAAKREQAHIESPHFTGVVLAPDGAPAAGANVKLLMLDGTKHVFEFVDQATVDKSGKFDLSIKSAPSVRGPLEIYATSPIGFAILSNIAQHNVLTLAPFTTVRVRYLDPDGNPVAHVRVYPKSFTTRGNFGMWDFSLPGLWTQSTDVDGWATFTAMPQGWNILIDVDDDRFAHVGWTSQISLASGPVTPDKTIHLQRGRTIAGHVVYSTTHKPVVGVFVDVMDSAPGGYSDRTTTDKDGAFKLSRLEPGSYRISTQYIGGNFPWVSIPQTALVTDANAPKIEVDLVHGAVISGKVTDKSTHKPVAGVDVYSQPTNVAQVTGADGKYSLRVAPGTAGVSAYSPGTPDQAQPQSITVKDGEARTVDFAVTSPPPTFMVHGTVVGPDGKPVPGADVIAISPGSQFLQATTDAKGAFAFDTQPLNADDQLFARQGNLATAHGVKPSSRTVTLRLTANSLTTIQGVVRNPEGQTIANAKLMLFQETGEHGISTDTSVSDAEGRYTFKPTFAGSEYMVSAQADGYGEAWSKKFPGVAGKTIDTPPVVMEHADSFIGGTVVDPKGNPIAGARVSPMLDSERYVFTDNAGHFHLTGVTRNKAIVEVRSDDGRFASIELPSGTNNNVITASSREELDSEGERFGKLMKADKTNHGDGTDAHKLLKAAETSAAASGRKVLLIFHASWCGPCFMLHRYVHDPQVKSVLDSHFVVQELDIWEHEKNGWENPGGVDIYKKYGGPNSVPFYVVLDPSGKKLGDAMRDGENTGADLDYFLKILKTGDPKITDAELSTMRARIKDASTF